MARAMIDFPYAVRLNGQPVLNRLRELKLRRSVGSEVIDKTVKDNGDNNNKAIVTIADRENK